MPSGVAIARRLARLEHPLVWIPLLLTALFAVLCFVNPSVIDGYAEALLVDYRFKVRNLFLPPRVPDEILIVTIDEKSLAAHGRWPWDRRLQASLIEHVFAGDPEAVAVDIFFPEPESPDSDRALAAVLAAHRDRLVVALGFEAQPGRAFDGEIPEPLYDLAIRKIENLRHLRTIDAFRVLMPPEPIGSSAAFGHVYTLPDRDGKLRWEALYLRYGDEYFPSLALQTARVALGVPAEQVRISGGLGVRIGERFVPTDEFGRVPVNYYGREGTIAHVSAADVLGGRVPGERFRGRVVFIGTSAIATYDLKSTPFSANMPGVEKNATVVANILQNRVAVRCPLALELLLILLIGVLVVWLGRKGKALQTVLVFSGLAFLVLAANQLVFSFWRVTCNLFYPLALVGAQGMLIISVRYLTEERKAREVRRIFSSYVTERVVNELIRNPGMTRLGGERRRITILFSDIRGFTTFSEAHAPEEVVAMLNEFLGAMTEVIFRWEGTLDKFVGDEIMAFWGSPLLQENHAELALRCALHMIRRLEELKEKWGSEGKARLDIGIGINSGEVLVGNIGAEGKKMEYTAIGDHVNLGARVESLTRRYNVPILITEFTFQEVRGLLGSGAIGHVSVEGLQQVIVKGREKPVRLYAVRSLAHGERSVLSECAEGGVVRMVEK
ncbi:MAG: adenylate/guanylate cyclase domain-containing protein [bacterium]